VHVLTSCHCCVVALKELQGLLDDLASARQMVLDSTSIAIANATIIGIQTGGTAEDVRQYWPASHASVRVVEFATFAKPPELADLDDDELLNSERVSTLAALWPAPSDVTLLVRSLINDLDQSLPTTSNERWKNSKTKLGSLPLLSLANEWLHTVTTTQEQQATQHGIPMPSQLWLLGPRQFSLECTPKTIDTIASLLYTRMLEDSVLRNANYRGITTMFMRLVTLPLSEAIMSYKWETVPKNKNKAKIRLQLRVTSALRVEVEFKF
jgi:hypothetical protein